MPLIQKIFFYSIACGILVLILGLVRGRYLKEYYSVLWLGISVVFFLLICNYALLTRVSAVLQVTPSIIVLFLGTVFLLLLVLQLSIINTKQAEQLKKVVQKMALLEEKYAGKKEGANSAGKNQGAL